MIHLISPIEAITVTINNPLGTVAATGVFVRVFNQILHFLMVFGTVVYVFAIMIVTYLIMTAAGNPTKISIAKKIFVFATIGFIIVVIAPGIFNFILSSFR